MEKRDIGLADTMAKKSTELERVKYSNAYLQSLYYKLNSNHSMRVSLATRLFESEVDEQLIMSRTGYSNALQKSSRK